jgi:deoxyribodipyrimidine photolyase-like uncharacterized protein
VLIQEDYIQLFTNIIAKKEENSEIKEVTLMSEGLLIYLSKEEQKVFFNNVRHLAGMLQDRGIKLSYVTIDMPTHQNFTDWLVHENFSHQDHIDVMKKVEPKILESLHETEKDFLDSNEIEKIKKHYYTSNIIENLQTPRLEKYQKITDLDQKIEQFLEQKTLFAWEVEM